MSARGLYGGQRPFGVPDGGYDPPNTSCWRTFHTDLSRKKKIN